MSINYISENYHKRIFGEEQPIVSAFKNTGELKLYGLENVDDPFKDYPELKIPDVIGTLDLLEAEIEVKVKPIKLLVNMLNKSKDLQVTTPSYQKGWQKYYKGKWRKCKAPKNSIMVLDTETTPSLDGKRSLPFLCVAQTLNEVYVWWGDGTKMVDLGPGNIIVAHNACYDRSMVERSYKFKDNTIWIDTLSLANAVRGVSTQQIAAWNACKKRKWEVQRWTKEYPGALSLDSLHKFYTGVELDKGERDKIVKMKRGYLESPTLIDSFSYCLKDVHATKKILKFLWEEWLDSCPSPIALSGMLKMSQELIPLSFDWDNYIERAETKYQEVVKEILDYLKLEAEKVKEKGDKEDAWYSQLDWSTTKNSKEPKWYRETKPKGKSKGLTLKGKDVAFILKITYDGNPVVWADFSDEASERSKYGLGILVDGKPVAIRNPGNKTNKKGEPVLVRSFFIKDFKEELESGKISCAGSNELKRLFELLISTVNWTSSQERLKKVFYKEDLDLEVNWTVPDDEVLGTITRRKKGPVWPVISNQKAKKIGTETKCYIKAPKGYSFVQTDVDSEELRLFALLGDFTGKGLVGTNPLSISVLCGQKSKGNDVHSLVAKQLEIKRDQAKGLVYGTIFGMSLTGFKNNLKTANPSWTDSQVEKKAQQYQDYFRTGYRGVPGIGNGSFNGMDDVFKKSVPRTHILKSAITKTLRGTTQFTTTRKNWVIQSAGRDFLDIYISFVSLIAEKMGVDMTLCMTVHDSIHYIVPNGSEEAAAYVIALAHTYTWALVVKEMDLKTLPKALLLPESIDVDYMIRKSPSDPCVTPSKLEESEPGYSLEVNDLKQIERLIS